MEELIKKEENKQLVKKYTPEELKKIILEFYSKADIDIDCAFKILSEEAIPKISGKDEKERTKGYDMLGKYSLAVFRALENETHACLVEAVSKQHQSLAKELSKQIIKDYDCKTSAEKLLAEDVAHSYIKILNSSQILNAQLNSGSTGPILNVFISVLSKQADRAHRQFITSLMTLKQIKSPAIEMNIKAHTAFVSDKQQINVNNGKNEIIESK
jgi:hypothetical protein